MPKANRAFEKRQTEDPVQSNDGDRNEQIAQLAYQYWENRGREDGFDLEDWLRAEQELAPPPVGGQTPSK